MKRTAPNSRCIILTYNLQLKHGESIKTNCLWEKWKFNHGMTLVNIELVKSSNRKTSLCRIHWVIINRARGISRVKGYFCPFAHITIWSIGSMLTEQVGVSFGVSFVYFVCTYTCWMLAGGLTCLNS